MLEYGESVLEMFKDLYPNDYDHGIEHHRMVLHHLLKMLELTPQNKEIERLTVFCVCIHDIVDYKYEHDDVELKKRIDICGHNTDDVLSIINNMSWSKRHINKVRDDLLIIRNLAQWADWIDAMRLDRCISYSKRVYANDWESNYKTCYNNKLIYLIDSIPGCYHSIALPLHQKLIDDYNSVSL